MDKWFGNNLGQAEFSEGKNDWKNAAEIAESCRNFILDDEDECTADEERSCYNCRYRRWTSSSFVCMQGGPSSS